MSDEVKQTALARIEEKRQATLDELRAAIDAVKAAKAGDDKEAYIAALEARVVLEATVRQQDTNIKLLLKADVRALKAAAEAGPTTTADMLKALLAERDEELRVEKHTVTGLRSEVRALKAEKGITISGVTHDEIAELRIKVAKMEPIVKLALHQKKIRAEASERAKERKAKGLATTRTKTEFQKKRGETNEARVIREAYLKAKVSVDVEHESMAVEAAPMAPIVKRAPPMIACDGCEEPVAKGKGFMDGESFHCDTCHEHYEPEEEEEEAAGGAGEE
jgi:hypothetical protein